MQNNEYKEGEYNCNHHEDSFDYNYNNPIKMYGKKNNDYIGDMLDRNNVWDQRDINRIKKVAGKSIQSDLKSTAKTYVGIVFWIFLIRVLISIFLHE